MEVTSLSENLVGIIKKDPKLFHPFTIHLLLSPHLKKSKNI